MKPFLIILILTTILSVSVARASQDRLTPLKLIHALPMEGAVSVRSDSLSGWLNQEDVNWDNFRLPAAD